MQLLSMATTGNNVRKRESREAAVKELVEEMYREWQIRGGNPSKSRDEESNQKVERVLSNQQNIQQTNKKGQGFLQLWVDRSST